MISDQIGLDLLRTYVAVCRQGSLNRVAAQTSRKQSALSMQMRRLESLLDKQLFQRTGRGVVPTPEGEVFLGYATRILALGDEALARLRQTALSGGLRIGLAEEVTPSALPSALGRLHRAYPDILLDVVVEHSVALGRQWMEEGLDVMIAPTSVVTSDAVKTWNVELRWVCASDYAVDEARPLDLVVFGATCPWRRRMIDALTALGREHRVVVTSQSVTALQAAIESGLGIGLLPPEAIRAQRMRVVTTGLPRPLIVQYGLYAKDRRTPAIEAALGVLLADLPAST
jgi:DNA-binding transcriptional LysR family regulator